LAEENTDTRLYNAANVHSLYWAVPSGFLSICQIVG